MMFMQADTFENIDGCQIANSKTVAQVRSAYIYSLKNLELEILEHIEQLYRDQLRACVDGNNASHS